MLTESTARPASSWPVRRMAALLVMLCCAPGFLLAAGTAAARADDASAALPAADAGAKTPPPGVFIYTVMRDGAPVGQQRIEVVGDGDKVRAISRTDIDVRFLGLSLYSFSQRMEEVREKGRMVSLTSDAEDDGTDKQLRLTRQGDVVKGSYNGKPTKDIDPALISSLFWQQPAVGVVEIVDCVRGKVRDATVTELDPVSIDLPYGKVEARHFKVVGEVKRELWFDADGVLVVGQLTAKDGSAIRSELLQRP